MIYLIFTILTRNKRTRTRIFFFSKDFTKFHLKGQIYFLKYWNKTWADVTSENIIEKINQKFKKPKKSTPFCINVNGSQNKEIFLEIYKLNREKNGVTLPISRIMLQLIGIFIIHGDWSKTIFYLIRLYKNM